MIKKGNKQAHKEKSRPPGGCQVSAWRNSGRPSPPKPRPGPTGGEGAGVGRGELETSPFFFPPPQPPPAAAAEKSGPKTLILTKRRESLKNQKKQEEEEEKSKPPPSFLPGHRRCRYSLQADTLSARVSPSSARGRAAPHPPAAPHGPARPRTAPHRRPERAPPPPHGPASPLPAAGPAPEGGDAPGGSRLGLHKSSPRARRYLGLKGWLRPAAGLPRAYGGSLVGQEHGEAAGGCLLGFKARSFCPRGCLSPPLALVCRVEQVESRSGKMGKISVSH